MGPHFLVKSALMVLYSILGPPGILHRVLRIPRKRCSGLESRPQVLHAREQDDGSFHKLPQIISLEISVCPLGPMRPWAHGGQLPEWENPHPSCQTIHEPMELMGRLLVEMKKSFAPATGHPRRLLRPVGPGCGHRWLSPEPMGRRPGVSDPWDWVRCMGDLGHWPRGSVPGPDSWAHKA